MKVVYLNVRYNYFIHMFNNMMIDWSINFFKQNHFNWTLTVNYSNRFHLDRINYKEIFLNNIELLKG